MINVVTVDDETIHLFHERCPDRPMEIWTRPGLTTSLYTQAWFWSLAGGRVLGHDPNMLVAIEKAMTALTHMVEGNPNDD